jgi:predicted Zn-dependent protease
VQIIRDGRISELYRTPFWAAKLGLPETFTAASGPPLSLRAMPGSPLAGKHRTLQDLIASTERGVYVANMWYLRLVTEMDGVLTGMTRDGLFEIKDGKITRPLVNMRWHDNLITALSRVSGMTDERQLSGRPRLAGGSRGACMAVPALRIENFHFSSATKF